MLIRDRIVELRRVRASDLAPHPRNWRMHPRRQQEALRGILAEVGFADALLARELPDGRLQLIDGHLRAATAPEQLVPVLVLDVDEQEAAKLLASLDPLAALAEPDAAKLEELLEEFDTESSALATMLAELAAAAGAATQIQDRPEPEIPETWQVVVHCEGEAEQRGLYERLRGEGYRCRVLVM
ncbi:MAG: ParB N-terminal domain-containing protein [Planctomycetes bacterium]|nr:ParB N-terminal domain-containing protein [Planctomycetota bacterium]